MASKVPGSKKPEYGLIILGNAGSGKSFIANILLDKQRFESEFQSEAVTTVTEHERVDFGAYDLLVYNIPGLVEVNQEQIDRNKREIMRAFEECPKSIVIFVWTQIGGRAQQDDVIAFQALNGAYKFVPESLAFIVNNLPPKRPPKYEGQFLTTLENALKPYPISVKDTIFLDNTDPEDKKKLKDMRSTIIHLVAEQQAMDQHKQHDILLQADQLKEERETLKRKQLEVERDKAAFQQQIQEMAQKYVKELKKAKERHEEAMQTIEKERKRSETQRAVDQAKMEQLIKQNKTGTTSITLACGGRACWKCMKCTTKMCKGAGNYAATGAVIGTFALPLIGTLLGHGIGALISDHSECTCK